MLRIRELDEGGRAAWDRFVDSCPSATFFHRSEWERVIGGTFGHATRYLMAEQDGSVVGVLPLVRVRSRLFGDALTSTPFCVYGGVAAVEEDARHRLEQEAASLADRLGVDFLELRNLQRGNDDWPTKDLYVTFRKAIEADHEVNLKEIPRKQRAMVRKGIKAGLTSEIDRHVRRFFPIYAESVRNLGTPVFPRRYFEALLEIFGDRAEVTVAASAEGEPLAAVLSFYFRDEVLPYYGGGTPEARRLKAYDFMYWNVMCRAADRGCRLFDYGRSKKGTGSYSFKKNWGFQPQPLSYQYHLVKARQIPDINPLNPRYQLFIAAWKRLPLPLANRLGPLLSRNLG